MTAMPSLPQLPTPRMTDALRRIIGTALSPVGLLLVALSVCLATTGDASALSMPEAAAISTSDTGDVGTQDVATEDISTTAVAAPAAAAPESRAVTFATGVAQLTGLAISPLLVLVALGWRDFLALGGSNAASLPLHANPWFLVPCTITLAAALLQRCTSPGMPLPIRKALDAGAYLEAKLAALVAAGVLLPTIASMMAAAASQTATPDPMVQSAGFLSGGLLTALVFIGAFAVYLSVWISFHVIDALIVLSPFAIIDAALLAVRASILAVLALALFVHPFLALLLALPIIVLSMLFAGWCVRLDLFALTVAGDLLFARKPAFARPRAFLARSDLGAPIRTMGHAEPMPSGVRFTYHPLFIFPKRVMEIPVASGEIVHGLVWPTLADSATQRSVIAFPPRFRTEVSQLATLFEARIREGKLRGGVRRLREALAALAGMLRGESTQQA